MKRFSIIAAAIFSVLMLGVTALAQTPVPMSSQPGLSYTENFADIANWTNGFASGVGANRFGAVAVNATGTIPDGVRTSVSSATFATSGSTGGLQRGSLTGNPAGTIVMLSTGTTDNSNSVAIDFFMDFTGVNAGTLSFDWASVNNATGDRKASLKVYWSTNGTTFTEIPAAQVLNFTNNSATSGSITTVALPAAFNNNPNARLRFYQYNGTGGTTGSRPKIAIDNLNVTATAVPVTPNLAITDVSQTEGNSGTSTYTFTVNLSSPAPAGGVTFDIATADGTATTADNDYVQKSLTGQTIAAGNSSYTFDVLVNGDTNVESNETFFVNVTNVTGANVTDAQGQGTIGNDDVAQPGTFVFSSASYTVTEGGTIDFTINRTGGTSGEVTVNYTINFVTATNGACGSGADTGNAGGSVTFADGQTSFTTGFGMCDDAVYELPETLTLNITSVTAGSVGSPSSATVTINDNDQAPQFTITDVYMSEGSGGGTTNFDFTVTKTGLTEYGASVDAVTSDGTANAGTDYSINSQTLSFAPNETTKSFTVAVSADTSFEPDENFFVNLSNAVNAVISDNQGVGTIFNDDVNGTVVQFERGNYQEDESQTVSVFVNRTGDTTGTTTVEYFTGDAQTLGGSSTPGTSCTGSADYITTSGTLTFNPGETQKEIQIPLCGENLKESFEVFPVHLTNATGGTIGEISTTYVEIDDAASQYVNPAEIGIGTSGDAIESSITVTNAPSVISSLRVTLFDFQHINSDNVDVLLVGPNGQNILLMADAGGASGLDNGATITFDDDAGGVLSDNGLITTGSYEPTTWEAGQSSFTAPAPAGPYNEPGSTVGGTPSLASVFGGTNANGTWKLYIRDDNNTFQQVGLGGAVAGGWGLSFIGPTAAGVSVSGLVRSGKTPLANVSVMITGGGLTQPLFTKTNNFGNYSFEGLAAGQTYVVTVFSSRYNFPQSSIVLNVADNVGDADFEAEDR